MMRWQVGSFVKGQSLVLNFNDCVGDAVFLWLQSLKLNGNTENNLWVGTCFSFFNAPTCCPL